MREGGCEEGRKGKDGRGGGAREEERSVFGK